MCWSGGAPASTACWRSSAFRWRHPPTASQGTEVNPPPESGLRRREVSNTIACTRPRREGIHMKSIIGLGVALAAALSFGGGSPADAQRPASAPHDDGQWTMPGKDYASTRFSGLAQI